MDKSVLDKIVNTAKQIFQDGTPIEKQIKFCETMIGVLEKSIPDWFMGQGFDTYEKIYNSGCGDDYYVRYIKPCWSDFLVYYEPFPSSCLYIGSRDDSDYRFGNINTTDDQFYDFFLYDVFRNEKERLEQIKAIEDFKQQLDDITAELTTSTPEIETTPEAEITPEAETGNPNPIVFYCLQSESDLKEIFDLLKKHKYIAPKSDLEDWLAICGKSKKSNEIKPLEWVKSQTLLCCLINTMFVALNPDKVWKISQNVFTIKGRKINVNTMKTTLSRIKNVKPPQDWKDLENLLNLNNK